MEPNCKLSESEGPSYIFDEKGGFGYFSVGWIVEKLVDCG